MCINPILECFIDKQIDKEKIDFYKMRPFLTYHNTEFFGSLSNTKLKLIENNIPECNGAMYYMDIII